MSVKEYFASALDGMAKGLFASLIVGVILKQIGDILVIYAGLNWASDISRVGQNAQYLMGPCIGAGVALKKNAKIYTVLAAACAGAIGAGTAQAIDPAASPIIYKIAVGEPAGAFLAALVGIEAGRLIEGKNRFDLLITPPVVILAGGFVGFFFSPYMSAFMAFLGGSINTFTELAPVPMGILLGVCVGMVLTAPISSAALCIAIGINGLAAGAALAGCCAQMVGFAVASFKENGFAGLFAQGLGTSMLQVPNIIKNPCIWIAPTVSGGLCGLLSATFFKMETTPIGAGMGTSGLVGQFTTFSRMGADSLLPMVILHFCIPAALTLVISEFLYKASIIKKGDMKI